MILHYMEINIYGNIYCFIERIIIYKYGLLLLSFVPVFGGNNVGFDKEYVGFLLESNKQQFSV